MRCIVGINTDDVKADYVAAAICFHESVYGTVSKRHELRSYSLTSGGWGTDDEVERKLAEFHQTDFFRKVEPLPGAVEGVAELSGKYRLVTITSRQKEIHEEIVCWERKHFGNAIAVFYWAKNYFSKGGLTKTEICRIAGVTVLIEDNLEIVCSAAAAGIRTIVFDAPWNQGELPKGSIRAYSWKEIPEIVSDLENALRSTGGVGE